MSAKDIRNIVLLGHGGSGKTTLAESMLFMTGGTDRFGKVTDGNTTCDYDAEEIKRQITISTSIAPVNFGGCKINVLDCPGYFDFVGDVLARRLRRGLLRAILRLGDVLIAIIFSHCCSLFVSRHSTWSAIVPLELLSKSKDTCSGSFLNVC